MFSNIPIGTYSLTFTTDDAQAPCSDISQTIPFAVTDCSDCCTTPIYWLNASTLNDTTIYSVDDLPPFAPTLNYTNGLTGDCLEEGNADATRAFPGGSTECGGIVTESWTYTSSCGVTLTHTRNITIEIVPPTWTSSLPNDTIVLCGQETNLIQDLSYDNGRTDSGIIEGAVAPSQQITSSTCGTTLRLSWLHQSPNNCYDSLYVSQSISVVDTNTYAFVNPPDDITITFDQLPLPDMQLVAAKRGNLDCTKDTMIQATCIENIQDMKGTIICTWTFDDPCSNQELKHSLTITVQDCVPPNLEGEKIYIRQGSIESINILDNDAVPDSFSVVISEIENNIFSSQKLDDDGTFLYLVEENFFDPIIVTYKVCNLSVDCVGDDNACQQGHLTIYDEELQDIKLTNLFTPNNDGLDDQLRFTVNPIIEDYELWIYNRWGNLIFHMKEYDNSWDASGYPGGVYYYVLRVKKAELKRTLTVVK